MEEIGESYLGIRSGISLSFPAFFSRLIVPPEPMGGPLNKLRMIVCGQLDVLIGNGKSLPDTMFSGGSFGLGSDSVNGCRGDLDEFSPIGRCPKAPSQ